MEFHVSAAARTRFGLRDSALSPTGHVVLPNLAATRLLAYRLNEARPADAESVQAGDLHASALLLELQHAAIAAYRRDVAPRVREEALASVASREGQEHVDRTLTAFVDTFPVPAATGAGASADAAEYLRGTTAGESNRASALEEMILVWLANENPALAGFRDLFDDAPLRASRGYTDLVTGAGEYLDNDAPPAAGGQQLLEMLRAPLLAAPDSLADQLRYIQRNWAFAAAEFGDRLALGLDILEEDQRALWMRFHQGDAGGDSDAGRRRGWDAGGYAEAPDLSAADGEPEGFSLDREWMPNLVLMAKSAYVWLDQLSRAHGRSIWRLDQIPDEELDRLSAAGFSGLWLIGLWERSRASQRIKQMRGNPDAVASAYSLLDYRISDDLGGDDAYRDLRDRAWARGIRLASDMVPNHMGIDSRWVVEHPDWFLSLDHSPYPSYTFNGVNLSSDERVGIYLEDHYWDNSDAAVVFKRVDRWSGSERYIYHGNDGTSFPWNDTAQLDYLRAEVREGVIQTILHVARQFPIIRFDAAMTLAKRHIQRLWFPEPGTGGAIPSRAEHGMTKAQFDAAMPVEFWREVVDRVAAEAPDTLLLAEAFWMLEGYFVRTLGMHRVYNSAFMHMLRDERNGEYRTVIKDTLTFDPAILQRYVNFMNNPDERTAIDQFGDGDKYFGVCTLLATLPGLPMFGHGQIEGFGEKYGMEYRRAQLHESPNEGLIARHRHDIFPLLRRRDLFARADEFLLYEFVTPDGAVDENVFAYSNRGASGERSLVVYNNRYGDTRGTIRGSVPYSVRDGGDGERRQVSRSLSDGLGISADPDTYLILRDVRSGLEYLHESRRIAEGGLWLELGAYRCHVFLDPREVHDASGRYRQLAQRLGGHGVASIDGALQDMELEPVQRGFRGVVNGGALLRLIEAAPAERERALADLRWTAGEWLDAVRVTTGHATDAAAGSARVAAAAQRAVDELATGSTVDRYLASSFGDDPVAPNLWLAIAVIRALGAEVAGTGGPTDGAWIDEWRLEPSIGDALSELGADPERATLGAAIVRAAVDQSALRGDAAAEEPVARWLADERIRRLIGVNVHEGTTWFDRDRFRTVSAWLLLAADPEAATAASERDRLWQLADAAGYRLDDLVALAGGGDGVAPEPDAPTAAAAEDESEPSVPAAAGRSAP